MAATRNPYYAKAYSNGTDGSAALAGDPIASQRRVKRPSMREHTPREPGLPVPRWVLLVAVALCLFFFASTYGGINGRKKELEAGIRLQAHYLAQTQTKIEETQAELALAADETRIRSIAANRLGMILPTQDQIVYIPRPAVQTETQGEQSGNTSGSTSLFDLMKSAVGR